MPFYSHGKRLAVVFIILITAALACARVSGQTAGPDPTPTTGIPQIPTPTRFIVPTATETPPTDTPVPLEPADRIFLNGEVLTMNAALPVAEAVAVRDGRIAAVGSESDVLLYRGAETVVIDLGGRTLMPGFVDTHSHAFQRSEGDFAGRQALLLENGITSVAEMFVTEDLARALRAFSESGELRMGVSLYPVHVDNCGEVLGPWYVDEFPPNSGSGARLQVPGVKIFADGGSCNPPAVSYEYPGGAGNGVLYFEAGELAGIIREAEANGYQTAIHALGDRAIDTALTALADVTGGDNGAFRHRLEHNAVLRSDMFSRYAEADPVATIFGAFPACLWLGDTSQFQYITPEEFRDMEWPWRPLVDQNPGMAIAWHSDFPIFSANPFVHLYGMVTRAQRNPDGGICEPLPWAADDRLTVEESLRMMTIEAAYALHRDLAVGSLEPGKQADMIIVSGNPLTVDPQLLPDLQVLATMVGGDVVYCVEGEGALCP